MSDPTTTTPTTTTTETKPASAHHAISQKTADELQLAGELSALAKDAKYAAALAGEEIDADFITNLDGELEAAGKLVGTVTGSRADKLIITQAEIAARDVLLAQIAVIQKRAKRKYTAATDPMRDKYFIAKRIDASRSQLETSTRALMETLAKDTLPGMKPGDVPALRDALKAYVDAQTNQTDGETDAVTAGKLLEAKVEVIAGLGRQIQLAADTLWPAGIPANAPIRVAFQIPPNRSLK